MFRRGKSAESALLHAPWETTMSRICTFPMAWSKSQSSPIFLSCPRISSLSFPRVFTSFLWCYCSNPTINTSGWRLYAINAFRASLDSTKLLDTRRTSMDRERDAQYMGAIGLCEERRELKTTSSRNIIGQNKKAWSHCSKLEDLMVIRTSNRMVLQPNYTNGISKDHEPVE